MISKKYFFLPNAPMKKSNFPLSNKIFSFFTFLTNNLLECCVFYPKNKKNQKIYNK